MIKSEIFAYVCIIGILLLVGAIMVIRGNLSLDNMERRLNTLLSRRKVVDKPVDNIVQLAPDGCVYFDTEAQLWIMEDFFDPNVASVSPHFNWWLLTKCSVEREMFDDFHVDDQQVFLEEYIHIYIEAMVGLAL